MFLIRGKGVKIAYIVRVDLSLSGGYIVGGDRGVGKNYPEGGMYAPLNNYTEFSMLRGISGD
jgi:hypothetical protein